MPERRDDARDRKIEETTKWDKLGERVVNDLEPAEREEFLRLLRKFVHLNTPAPEDDADMPDQPSDSA